MSAVPAIPTEAMLAKRSRSEHIRRLRFWSMHASTTRQQRELRAAADFFEAAKPEEQQPETPARLSQGFPGK